MTDLYAIIPAVSGKIELVYEGEQEGSVLVAHKLIGQAVASVFVRHFPRPAKTTKNQDDRPVDNPYEAVLDFFSSGKKLELCDTMPLDQYRKTLAAVVGLKEIALNHYACRNERETLLVMEFILEGLHHHDMIARDITDSAVQYGDIFSRLLKGIDSER
jgi:magnesium chelatase subunit I